MSLIVKGGTVVTATGEKRADVRCRDGLIVEIGNELERHGEEVVDASGCLVFPGAVDPHVHMQLPVAGTVSSDTFESGTTAALAGGTTTILDFVHPERGEPWGDALAARLREAGESVCDYGFHMAVTWWCDRSAAWMASCVEQGIPSFKTYMAYKETVGLEDADLIAAMQAAADLGALILVHAEHGDAIEHLRERSAARRDLAPRFHARTRPSALEGEATNRAAVLAGVLGAPLYVVHVTCAESVRAIAAAREKGWPVAGETCPQYLLLDDSVYERDGFESAAYVIAPPIRPLGHQERLWEALAGGVLDAVGTDHCPFTMAQKRLGESDFRLIPGGAAGVEHRLALLWTHGVSTGRISAGRFVELVSTAPAKLFGLFPRKGALATGSDADLVVWDRETKSTISATTDHHRCDRSIFEGFQVEGLPRSVIAAGRVCAFEGSVDVERGRGRFLHRSTGAGL